MIPPRAACRSLGWRGAFAVALAAALASTATAEPSSSLRVADPAARLPEGGAASEHWEVTVRLDSGHWILARFIVTHFGPGDRNAAVLGHVVKPDGGEVLFSNARFRRYWNLSEDRRTLDVGTSHLDLHDPLYRLWIDKDKARIDLRFAPDALPLPGTGALPEGYHLEVLALAAPIRGTLQLRDMPEPLAVSGHISVVHTWMNEDESQLTRRRIEFHSLADDALYVLDLTARGGKRWNWLLARAAGGEPVASAGFEASLEASLPGVERLNYWVPAGIHWFGACVEGFASLSRPLLQSDPLELLPQPIRWLVGLRIKPHRVWATSGFDVTLRGCSDRPPLQMLGTGITALTFTHPVGSP